jgi:hypothetical protein
MAEYVLNKHALDTTELKWGQGVKCVGGDIRVGELGRAQGLKRRGCIVTPDPTLPDVVGGLQEGRDQGGERRNWQRRIASRRAPVPRRSACPILREVGVLSGTACVSQLTTRGMCPAAFHPTPH